LSINQLPVLQWSKHFIHIELVVGIPLSSPTNPMYKTQSL